MSDSNEQQPTLLIAYIQNTHGNGLYDLVLVHGNLSAMSDNEVFGLLRSIFPDHGLYRISEEWRKDKRYILKAKGTRGDVIVGWQENQLNRQESLKHCPIL
jgi:hypothetical protein